MYYLKKLKEPKYRFLLAFTLESGINNICAPAGLLFTSLFLFVKFEENQIAILLSLVGVAQLLQIFSSIIYKYWPNKKFVIITFRFLASLLTLMIGLLPLFIRGEILFVGVFVLILIRFSILNLIGGGFLEWCDRYVPEEVKGKYYGTRNSLLNLMCIICAFFIGVLLDYFPENYYVYIFVLSVSLIMFIFEWIILKDIEYKLVDNKKSMRLIETIAIPLKDKRYVNFIMFTILWMLAISIGLPLINIYLIKYMKYSYRFIAIAQSTVGFVKIFAGVLLGSMIDKKGVCFVIKLCGIGFAIFNFFFIFMTPGSPIIYFVALLLNGICMIGFNVSKFRLNVKLSKGEHMNEYLSTNTTFMGLATFVSIYLSSFVIKFFNGVTLNIGNISVNSYQMLFFISSILQLLAVYYFVKTLYERDKKHGEIQSAGLS